jgi:autotransporter-associated beta strand protein
MSARADTNLWTGASGTDANWSTAGNWSNGVPTAATQVFFGTNAAVSDTYTVNNIVDANTTVSLLNYIQRQNLYHNTQIADGVTLTVTNATSTTNVLFAGANTNASGWTTTPTVTTISGLNGTLAVNAPNGTVQVRNGGNNNFNANSRAILDLSQLGTFSANVNRFLCAGDGSTLLGSGITLNYMYDRAAAIVYLAKTNYLVFGSTSDWGVRVSYTTASQDCTPGSLFYLGYTNGIFTDYGIGVGCNRSGVSSLTFNPANYGSTAYFRSRSGGRQSYWYIANTGGNGYTSSAGAVNAMMDFSQGTVDAMVNLVRVGVGYNNAASYANGAASNVRGTLVLGPGVLNANTMVIGWHYQNYSPYVIGTVTVDGSGIQGSSQLIVNNGMTLGQFNNYAFSNGVSQAVLNVQNGGKVTVYGKITTLFTDPNNADSEIHVTANSSLYTKGLASVQTLQLWQSALTLDVGVGLNPSVPVCTVTNLDTLTPATLNVVGGGGLTPGQFKLIQYQNLLNNGFDAFTLNLPPGLQGYLSNNTANSSIDLVITNLSFISWNGTNNSLWDINTTPNWRKVDGTPVTYQELAGAGDLTQFDDTAQGTTTVSLVGTLSPGSISVSNASKPYTFTGAGRLAGTATVSKSGSGEMTLANTGINTFSGGLYLNGGTLTLASGGVNAFAGGVHINGGTLRLSGADNLLPTTADLTVAADPAATLDLNGFNQTLNSISGGGNVALGAGNLSVNGGGSYGGVISGSGRLTNSGAQLTLTGDNPYTGGARINSTLVAGNATGSATGPGNIDIAPGAPGGILQIGVTNTAGSVAAPVITNNGTILFIRTDTTTCTNFITGSGGVTFVGPGYTGGTVVFDHPNAYSNTTWIVNGALRISHPYAVGYSATILIANGLYDGRLELTGGITVTNNVSLGPKDPTLNGNTPNIVNLAGTNTLSGPFGGVRGGTDWVLRSDAGRLVITSPFVNGATTVANYNLWLRGAASGQFNALADGTTSGVKSTLYKQDGGDWTLTGASTYTGSTYILGGLLLVNGSLTGTTNVIVGSGATLGGTGFIAGPVTVSNTAVLRPGGMSIGTLTISNTLTLLDGSTNLFVLASAGNGNISNGQIQGVSTLTYGGTLKATLAGALMGGEVFKLFSANSYSNAFSTFDLPVLPPALSWDTSQLTVDGTLRVMGGIRIGQIVSVAQGTGGSFQIQISGTGSTNQPYRVLATTNIDQPVTNWVEVGSGTFTGGVFTFTDQKATNYPARFYRLVTP